MYSVRRHQFLDIEFVLFHFDYILSLCYDIETIANTDEASSLSIEQKDNLIKDNRSVKEAKIISSQWKKRFAGSEYIYDNTFHSYEYVPIHL